MAGSDGKTDAHCKGYELATLARHGWRAGRWQVARGTGTGEGWVLEHESASVLNHWEHASSVILLDHEDALRTR